jgi:hypothetical protein
MRPLRTFHAAAGSAEERFDLKPDRLAADTAYGTGKFLGWLVGTGITPHIPVWEGPDPDDGATISSSTPAPTLSRVRAASACSNIGATSSMNGAASPKPIPGSIVQARSIDTAVAS